MAGLGDVQLFLVNDVESAGRFMSWLGERRPDDVLAIDTETTGLDWTTDTIRMFQVGDAMTGWAIPWQDWAGVALEFLRRYAGRLLMHNSKYDTLMIERDLRGIHIPWGRVDDTMLMAYALDQHLTRALKTLAGMYVDPAAPMLQRQLDDAMGVHGWDWDTVPIDFQPYWAYGALDPVLTCRVREQLVKRMHGTPSQSAYDLELQVTGVLLKMMKRGAPIDVEYAMTKFYELSSFNEQLRDWCKVTHGCLPGSLKLADRLIELGATLTKTTSSGRWSTDKDVLHEVAVEVGGAAGELASTALRSKRLGKITNTYLGRFVNDSIDGRVYCDINVVGAEKTSRMSMTGPGDKAMPLHQLPRKDNSNAESIAVRNCFRADEGYKLIMCDYEQIEWRLIGHFSQDPALLEILNDTSTDPFLAMCRQIYGDPSIAKKDHRRQMTKNAAYAKGYGAGAAKFSLTAGVPLSVGGPFYEAFDATYPTLKAFQMQVQRLGERRLDEEGEAWVRTPWGHKLVAAPDKCYTLVNRLIQGTAANVLKYKLCELDSAGLINYAILPVHDEVVFHVPDDMTDAVMHEAARVMDASELFTVPMPVGVDGPYERWGDKYADAA